jgi:hypothetical protein
MAGMNKTALSQGLRHSGHEWPLTHSGQGSIPAISTILAKRGRYEERVIKTTTYSILAKSPEASRAGARIASAKPTHVKKTVTRWWACENCGFSCPWWLTADAFKLCAACDSSAKAREREARKAEAKEAEARA